MGFYSTFFFLFIISSVSACDRCIYQGKVAFFSSSAPLSSGACGYGPLALGFYGGRLGAGAASLYRNGVGCGGCFQIRCKNPSICSKKGTTVVLTDLNKSNETDFVLSDRAFRSMALNGKEKDVMTLGIADVEYKRVMCVYKNQNLSVRVEESSQRPHYLAVKFLFQGGQTDIVAADVAQVGSSNWNYLSRNYGAVWDTSRVPAGPLMFRLVVTGGYDGKWIWAPKVLPTDWKAGAIYDAGVQISDIAKEGCSPETCGDQEWK
ncbi:hypothetical protein Scep_000180 [Stephania cephalantha]|uniref:Expansin-like A2 n=1 Tax=Stephania cephalantha TaxID=152367 RepID=A0AAP0L9A2_9MAGN